VIDKNKDLSKVLKIWFFMSFLTDATKKVLVDFEISNQSCKSVWELFLNTQNDPVKIIRLYIRHLIGESSSEPTLHDTLQTVCTATRVRKEFKKIEGLGASDVPWVLAILMGRCDSETVHHWPLITAVRDILIDSFLSLAVKRTFFIKDVDAEHVNVAAK
jgi:Protein of unknown function (DUF1759)